MMRDYSQTGDPYGISEYTAQSADTDVTDRPHYAGSSNDVRGNTIFQPRSVPTQAEADALKGAL